jgi:hypothetical protein
MQGDGNVKEFWGINNWQLILLIILSTIACFLGLLVLSFPLLNAIIERQQIFSITTALVSSTIAILFCLFFGDSLKTRNRKLVAGGALFVLVSLLALLLLLSDNMHSSNIQSIQAPKFNMVVPQQIMIENDVIIEGNSLDLNLGNLYISLTHEQQYNVIHRNSRHHNLSARVDYTFNGDLSANQPHGRGRLVINSPSNSSYFLDGAWYEGDWIEGRRSGYGVFVWVATGDWYKGDWIDGQHNGFGTFVWSEKNEWYEGDWVNGRRQGVGIYSWVGTAWYEGDFRNDLMHGYGKKYWESGDWYRGYWIRGHRHGEGVMWNNETGVLQDGIWSNDVFLGD